jgi:hypothetical protein
MIRGIVILLTLSACNAPSPLFREVTATRVTVDNSVFDVRVRGTLAEAIRINPQYAPRFGPIRDQVAFAMAQVSGCLVTDVLGDQAQATGLLVCDNRSTRRTNRGGALRFDCLEVQSWVRNRDGQPYFDYECDPY